MYRKGATGLELSNDVVLARDYIAWVISGSYPRLPSLYN